MHVFVTGASGWIGAGVTKELLAAGHTVHGLARSDASAATVAAAGAQVHRGSLEDVESLRRGAAAADGVVHAAFIQDFLHYDHSAAVDRTAMEAMFGALEGSGKPFVAASATMLVEPGRLGTEDDAPSLASPGRVRVASENMVVGAAARGIRSSIIRLPPTVHGDGDHSFVPKLIGIARAKGVSGYIGDGSQRWPAVHLHDAARLFRLVLENGHAGARWHGVNEEGIPTREIAGVIGRRLNVPVASIPAEQAAEHFGFLARFFGVNSPASSAHTRRHLGWQPSQRGLIADLERPPYFAP